MLICIGLLVFSRCALYWYFWHCWWWCEGYSGGKGWWDCGGLRVGQFKWANAALWECECHIWMISDTWNSLILSQIQFCCAIVVVIVFLCLQGFVWECHINPGWLRRKGNVWWSSYNNLHRLAGAFYYVFLRTILYGWCKYTVYHSPVLTEKSCAWFFRMGVRSHHRASADGSRPRGWDQDEPGDPGEGGCTQVLHIRLNDESKTAKISLLNWPRFWNTFWHA